MVVVNEKLLNTLEYHAVRDLVRPYCLSVLGKNVVACLVPFDTHEKAERALHPGQSRIEIGFIRSGQIFRTSHVNGEGPIRPHCNKKT